MPSSGGTSTPKLPASERAEHERYMAEDDIRTLARAREIEGDTSRLSRARRHVKRLSRVLGKPRRIGGR